MTGWVSLHKYIYTQHVGMYRLHLQKQFHLFLLLLLLLPMLLWYTNKTKGWNGGGICVMRAACYFH